MSAKRLLSFRVGAAVWFAVAIASGWSVSGCSVVTAPGPAGDVEEARVAEIEARFPQLLAVHASRVEALRQDLLSVYSSRAREQAVAGQATTLWLEAVAAQGERFDDRPLYWSRLAMRRLVRELAPADEQAALLSVLEDNSRGLLSLIKPDPERPVVIVTGFDPFFLDEHLDQSNPSGLAALNLHGRRLTTAAGEFEVRTMVVPVRFADFDAGLIERIADVAIGLDAQLVLTVSMGRAGFDLERFPARRRSAQVPDNRNVLTGASAVDPLVPLLAGAPLEGPEFVEFSLPALALTSCESGPFGVTDNRVVSTLEAGELTAASLADLSEATSVAGSGGGYLSNEISYRMLRALASAGSPLPSGHLHTPRVEGFDAASERQIVAQIDALLGCAVEALLRP